MQRELHVRFCEGGGVQFPSATRLVMGFNSKADADQFRAELTARMRKFNLELHPEKTRLLEFGP
jgi:RNA-directed DNA polymerase